MGIRLPGILAKQMLRRSAFAASKESVPKGFIAVYVGKEQKKRCLVPVSYLNQPSFQDLLHLAEEEFGYVHPMGALTIPCSQHTFNHVISNLSR